MKSVDLFVIGGGSGGVRAARVAAQQGANVVLAESSKLGGTCVNLGCVPKKLYSYATYFGYDYKDAAGYGWESENTALSFNWAVLQKNKNQELSRLNEIYAQNLSKANVTVIFGQAKLTDPNTVVVNDESYECKNILIATGGKPTLPTIDGYQEHAIVSDDIFALEQLPEKMIVAGAGYIAVEFACILAGFGVEVSLVHRGPTVLKKFDVSIQETLLAEMEELGVNLQLNTSVEKIAKKNGKIDVTFKDSNEVNLTVDAFLCATGRKPNSANLGLEEVGVELKKNGAIIVDENFQTNIDNIYAVGDVIDRVALTPVAIAEAMNFVAKKFGGYGPEINYDLIPTAVFTHPNVGTVGLTEAEAKEKYPDCEVCMSEFTPMKFSLSSRKEKAMVKLIFKQGGGEVLGAHMVGPDAGELMQGIAVALAKGATKKDFDAMVGIHPTTAEEFVSLR